MRGTGSSGQRRLRRIFGAVPRLSSGEGTLAGVAVSARQLRGATPSQELALANGQRLLKRKKNDLIRDRPVSTHIYAHKYTDHSSS
jgi:hypothetical protein